METGIAKAIRIAGSQTALGNLLGLTPQAIQKWFAQGVVPGDRCREVEAALNHQVSRYELNPAVFGDGPIASDTPGTQGNEQDSALKRYRRRKDDLTPDSSN